MGKIAGTTYFKIDGQQLSVTGGIEVPPLVVVQFNHGRSVWVAP